MERNDAMILEQLRSLELQVSEEKKEALMGMICVYMEVLKRCPYLAETPRDELKEFLRILKEQNIL